LESREREYNNS